MASGGASVRPPRSIWCVGCGQCLVGPRAALPVPFSRPCRMTCLASGRRTMRAWLKYPDAEILPICIMLPQRVIWVERISRGAPAHDSGMQGASTGSLSCRFTLQQSRTSISCTFSTSSPLVSSIYPNLVLAPWVTSLTILSRVNVLHTSMAMIHSGVSFTCTSSLATANTSAMVKLLSSTTELPWPTMRDHHVSNLTITTLGWPC